MARNAGIERACGEFLCFVDADDCLMSQTLEIMTAVAEESGAQICSCSFVKGVEFHDSKVKRYKVKTYDYVGILSEALYQKKLINSAWGMIVKRDLVKEAGGFREGVWYEDLDSFYRIYELAAKIAYIDAPLYFYRQNPGSFLHRWSDGRLDVLDVTDRMVDYLGERYPELKSAAMDRRFSAHYNMALLMLRNGVDRPDAMERCLAVIREGRRKALLDRRVRLKNKVGALVSYFGLPTLRLLSKL